MHSVCLTWPVGLLGRMKTMGWRRVPNLAGGAVGAHENGGAIRREAAAAGPQHDGAHQRCAATCCAA